MRKPTTYAGLGDFEQAVAYYRQDLWVRSDVYVEVWCENDPLADLLMPVTSEYDVPLTHGRCLMRNRTSGAATINPETASRQSDTVARRHRQPACACGIGLSVGQSGGGNRRPLECSRPKTPMTRC
jgi:hypothetical protein